MSKKLIKEFPGIVSRLILGVGLCLAAPAVFAEYALNFQKPVTPVAHRILELHNMILLICVIIFVIVFGVMFYSIFAHRKSRGYKPATFHDNATLEVVWTVIPFLILVSMAIPSTATLLEMSDTSKSDLTIKITGYQWKWKYDYPDQDVSFFSTLATPRDQVENKAAKGEHYLLEVDNPIVVPVGKKVRFLVTANDVIHSWWVPQLGVKKDAIPGFINEFWTRADEVGTFRGQCAELCGKDHGFMPIVVNAVSPEDFTKWVAVQKGKAAAESAGSTKTWSKDELMEKGKKAYAATCAACHGPEGKGIPGVFPALEGSKIATGPVEEHIKTVLHGRASGKFGAQMPSFAAQLSDADAAAIITFERNALGNKTGDVVQPSQVKDLRK
ncbi:cytochrome c oxidase subunit II [Sulfuricaulis sp.]|jgi:cytochrome c oxidase subunit 2|uniref:cytochrome c oxidase subunit II n=1 Tax=Sulfuricaulis sp. TaxID=2003553 RepID=UPI0035596E9E